MDHPQNESSPDKERIDISDADQLTYWTDKFDTTKVRLKAVVNAVGPSVKDVEAYLRKNNRNT
ncbi:MAG TPA: DUF3606 domain-containing protein [Mucilaginibacter sp.]